MPLDERSILRVEGRDDKFVIENLLRRHDVDFAHVDIKPTEEGEGTGLPYGTAITARCLGHDSPAALGFVEWFRRLFDPRRTADSRG